MKVNPGLVGLLRNVTALEPDPNNTRKHPPEQIDQIASWLQEHGQQRPILLDENDRVVAGNGVFLAVRKLGWPQVAALTYQGPSPRRFSIIDNRSAELSEWDVDALRSELEQFDAGDFEGLGFALQDLESIGVDLDGLQVDLGAAEGLEAEGGDEEDKPKRRPRSKDYTCPNCGKKFTEGE